MTKTFSELIRHKEHLLRELLPLSMRQRELVQQSDINLLLKLLGLKQEVMDEFEQIELELAPFRNIPPEQREWKNAEDQRSTTESLKNCENLLKKILENDTQSTDDITIQKTELEEQIRRVEMGTQINASYAKQAVKPSNVRHLDVTQ